MNNRKGCYDVPVPVISSLPIKISHTDHHYNHGMIVLQSQTEREYRFIIQPWDVKMNIEQNEM